MPLSGQREVCGLGARAEVEGYLPARLAPACELRAKTAGIGTEIVLSAHAGARSQRT